MASIEQNAVDDSNVYDLMVSASTLKKDSKKYELAKAKLNIPDTKEELLAKEKLQSKLKKKEDRQKDLESVSTVKLITLEEMENQGKISLPAPQAPVLLPLKPSEILQKTPEVKVNMEEINTMIEEYVSDDEESIADKNSNKDLMKINITDKKAKLNIVKRNEENEKIRRSLPVFMHEREILEGIENNLVTIICGETGSGKSTQIPQILYEYGYTGTTRKGMIGITQPRRVAATSLSKRIADEMSVTYGEEVGYQIRYDKKFICQNTVIKLMTDGILLKELELDSLLEKYSVIIIDEAHERSINTDILISLLSRIVKLRLKHTIKERAENKNPETHVHFPLRLVIMSATLRVDDFIDNKRLFPSLIPRLIKIESRQYSVDIHFNKITKEDYEEETFKKVCKIHRTLPPGGILVFLTGRKEIQFMVERLKIEFRRKFNKTEKPKKQNEDNKEQQNMEIDEESEEDEKDEKEEETSNPIQVLPLYSMLPPEQQHKVFKPPKAGHRLIVVSTNIAETSITIPNIRYVVDWGREKQKVYDPHLRLSKFLISWVSKASADQRAGRAGRTGDGHCYRLYSSTVFTNMEQYAIPEILRIPLDQTVLQLKALGISDLWKFPFVSSPNMSQIKATLRELWVLNALELKDKSRDIEDEFKKDLIANKDEKFITEENQKLLNLNFNRDFTKITDLGYLLSTIPLAPKFAKMLIFGRKAKLIELAIITVASLTVQELFLPPKVNINIKDPNMNEFEFSDEDPDLMTQIDIDNKMHKLNQKKRELKEQVKKQKEEQLALNQKIKEKWYSERGDIHTNVLAIGAYLQFKGQLQEKLNQGKIDKRGMYEELSKFIRTLYLNKKSIDEIVNLWVQLQTIMIDLNPGTKIDIYSISPPNAKEQTLLQQLILVGFPENIVKKKEVFNDLGVDINLQRKRPEYECLFSHQSVYLHSTSNLKSPKFVWYKEIQQVNVRPKNEDDPGIYINIIL